jgi:ATP-dependent RNA helicase RhlE
MNNPTKNRRGRGGSSSSHRKAFSITKPNHKRGGFQSGRYKGRSGGHSRTPRKMPSFNPSRFINTNPVDEVEEIYEPKHSFGDFGLNNKLTQTIKSLGLENPSPIQDQIIPEILSGHDVIGLAETGTGKTAAFLIPLIEKTLKDNNRMTLVLAPTRELALQIEQELKSLSAGFRIPSVTCVGGMNIRPQIKALRRHNNNFIIGTPGRILDLINRKCFHPKNITTVVLDEADRMLDMGFIHDMRKILETAPKSRETLLFSATMPKEMIHIVNDFLQNPISISVKKKDVAKGIEQDVVPHGHHDKFETLIKLLEDEELRRVLIFGSMKHSVQKLARQLSQNDIKADSIHGNKTHSARQKALAKFKSGNARVLVATDVAARGIHVDGVTHVINYDLPNTFEDYVHRIGRTGRGEKRGKALTFVSSRN